MFLDLDVVGLFPHIPKAVTMEAMDRLLTEANVGHDELTEFFALLNCCWCPNYCQFKGEIFEFPDEVGIRIGSLWGSLLAEVFMHTFEKNLFTSNHPLLPHVVYRHRYVDDGQCLWSGTSDELSTPLDQFYP